MADEICALGVAELAKRYRTGALSPVEVVRATLERIDRLNPELNAYQTVLADSAMEAARAAERQLSTGIDLGPLQGVPFSVKDIMRVKGTRTTAGSKILLDGPLDQEDAPVVSRLRGAGAILIGKAKLFEFAFGAPDPEGPFGNVQNPRKLGHQPGSSSGGSGAATAAGLGAISIGTDTGGSIRIPAALCGVAGLKPTRGLVPIRDVIPLSVHLDHVGPLGRSVADLAAALSAMAGPDPADLYSAQAPGGDYLSAIGRDVKGFRLGIPTNAFFKLGHPAPLALQERARSTLADLGLAPIHLELPRIEESNDVADVIINCDLWTYHQQHQHRAELYGRDLRSRMERGKEMTGIQYAQARVAQEEIRRDWLALFERVDLVVLPQNVTGAPLHGQDTIEVDGEKHVARVVNNRCGRISNLTGFPSLVVTVGETPEGLPVGVQLVGPPFGEGRLFAVGHALEQALGNLPAKWGIEPRR